MIYKIDKDSFGQADQRVKGEGMQPKKVFVSQKNEEGLEIKDLIAWNKADVGKLIWELLTAKSPLWAEWVKKTN